MESEAAGSVRDREENGVLWSESLSLREEVADRDRQETSCANRFAVFLFILFSGVGGSGGWNGGRVQIIR